MELSVKKHIKHFNSISFCKERFKGARHSSAERPATGVRLEIPVEAIMEFVSIFCRKLVQIKAPTTPGTQQGPVKKIKVSTF